MKAYAERYWEMFNEIDGNFDKVAVRTFNFDAKKGLCRSIRVKQHSGRQCNLLRTGASSIGKN